MPMMQLCRHIKTSGHRCAAIALSRHNFCYHHDHLHIERRSSGLRSQLKTKTPIPTHDLETIPVPVIAEPNPPSPVSLEFPEDPAAILTNIYRVTNLLVQGQIDRPTANSVTYGMQVCLTALSGKSSGKSLFDPAPQTHSQSPSRNDSGDGDSETTYSDRSNPATAVSHPVHRVILTPDGDEIAPPAEILEDNEAEPIHHRLCPCLLCAEKYRNQPPEEHHPDCQCGLCEEQETAIGDQPSALPSNDVILSEATAGSGVEGPAVSQASPTNDVILSEVWRFAPNEVEGPAVSQALPNNDVILSEARNACGVEGPAVSQPGNDKRSCRPRIARASALLSGSTSRDPLNRPWSVAEYTFGDAIRRHEAQYAARAAAALAVGIEPPPYEPYITGLLRPGTPEHDEDQQMQQHSSEYWSEHFRKQIAERPDIQRYLDEEAANDAARATAD